MSSVCRKVYKDYGSYLRSRGFDKQTCDYLARIESLEEKCFDICGGELFGDLDMNYNLITDVSAIVFGNGAILNQVDVSNLILEDIVYKTGTQMKGNIDMSNNNITKIKELGIYNGGSLLTDISNTLILSALNILRLSSIGDISIIPGTSYSANVNGLLNLLDNSINNVGSLELTNSSYPGRLTSKNFNVYASPNENLPSYIVNNKENPVSLVRQTIYYNDVSYNVTAGPSTRTFVINNGLSNYEKVNQMGLSVDASNIITPPTDIEGQYVEIYITINVTPSGNNTEFSIDISGIDNTLYETVDIRSVSKNATYNLSYGPLLIMPSQFVGGNKFEFLIVNSSTSPALTINSSKLVLKSYLI